MKYLFFLLIFFFVFKLDAQDKKAVLEIDTTDEFAGFGLLDSSLLSNYNLFFTGEDHRFLNTNSKLEFKMFKYLHKTAGVRTFIAEFGPSLGYFMNRFICQGDTVAREILRKYSFDEYFELYEKLHKFYDSLPAEEKFDVQTIDIEREGSFAIKRLDLLLPNNTTAHDSIRIHIEAIKAVAEYYDIAKELYKENEDGGDKYDDRNDDDTIKRHQKEYLNDWQTMDLVYENYAKFKNLYKEYLGENFGSFDESMRWIDEHNIWERLNQDGVAQGYIMREIKMESNISNLFTKNPGMKAFGQFGRCHTQQTREREECLYYYFNSLATRLNSGSHPQLAGKVFSCPIFYPLQTDFIDDKVVMNKGLAQFINNAEKDKVTLFLIDSTSDVYPSIAQRFNALIINYTPEDGFNNNDEEGPDNDAIVFTKKKKNRSSIMFDAGTKGYGVSNLNNKLGVDFNIPLFYGITFNVYQNKGMYINNRFGFTIKQTQRINDSASASFSGYNIQACIGTDLSKNKNLDVAPWIGLGFDRLTLQTNETYTDETRKDVFGNDRVSQYNNPGFNLGLGADIRVHINWFTFGVFGGFQYDLSNRNWRINDKITKSVPKTAVSIYTVGFCLGINY